MSSNFKRRNARIREFCRKKERQYPHWKWEYILKRASEKYFLSTRTINAIVKGEGIYSY